MRNFLVKAHCAGILVFETKVYENEFSSFMVTTKEEWKRGELKISFGSGQIQVATEICLDVYEDDMCRFDLSKAFKP